MCIKIDKKDHHYLKNVMRLKNTEEIKIFNKSEEYKSEIINIDKGIINPVELLRQNTSVEYNISLAFCIIKRSQFLIEKATELGVDEIYPLKSQHSMPEFNANKINSWVKEALEQSNQIKSLQTHKPLNLKDLDKLDKNYKVIVLNQHGVFINEITESIIKKNINTNKSSVQFSLFKKKLNNGSQNKILLVIGPEGGFSQNETEYLKKYTNVRISNNILRAETCAISAISIFGALLNCNFNI